MKHVVVVPGRRQSKTRLLLQYYLFNFQKGTDMTEISCKDFRDANVAFCESPDGFNHPIQSWALDKWFTAIMGELGEAFNVMKKLYRVEGELPGNKENLQTLVMKLGEELADTYIYLDLTEQYLNHKADDTPLSNLNLRVYPAPTNREIVKAIIRDDLFMAKVYIFSLAKRYGYRLHYWIIWKFNRKCTDMGYKSLIDTLRPVAMDIRVDTDNIVQSLSGTRGSPVTEWFDEAPGD